MQADARSGKPANLQHLADLTFKLQAWCEDWHRCIMCITRS